MVRRKTRRKPAQPASRAGKRRRRAPGSGEDSGERRWSPPFHRPRGCSSRPTGRRCWCCATPRRRSRFTTWRRGRKRRRSRPCPRPPRWRLSADSRYLALGTSTGILAVESTQAGKVAWKTRASGQAIAEVLFTLDGSLVIVADAFKEEGDAWFRVYQTDTGREDTAFEPVAGARVGHLALSPDGLFLRALGNAEPLGAGVAPADAPDGGVHSITQGERADCGIGVRRRRAASVRGAGEPGFRVERRERAAPGGHGGGRRHVPGADRWRRDGGDPAQRPARRALNFWNAESGRLRRTIALPAGDYGPLAAPPAGAHLALPGPQACWIWKAGKLVT